MDGNWMSRQQRSVYNQEWRGEYRQYVCMMKCVPEAGINGTGTNDYIAQILILWNVITCPCPCSRLQAQKSSIIKGRDMLLHPTEFLGCNYLSLNMIPVSGTRIIHFGQKHRSWYGFPVFSLQSSLLAGYLVLWLMWRIGKKEVGMFFLC